MTEFQTGFSVLQNKQNKEWINQLKEKATSWHEREKEGVGS
jgi:uncharacterized membrane protein (DUF106 family)